MHSVKLTQSITAWVSVTSLSSKTVFVEHSPKNKVYIQKFIKLQESLKKSKVGTLE